MKRFFRIVLGVVFWSLIAAAGVELLSFGVISASNYIIYGQAREGSSSVYNAYSLYLMSEGVEYTGNNSYDPGPGMTRTVWFFGGSTMRASNATMFTTIPGMIAGVLNAEDNYLSYFCENYAVNSFNSLLETKYLQKLLIERVTPPDLIVYYDGANDASYLSVYRTPEAHDNYDKVKGLIESYHHSTIGLFKSLTAAWFASFTRELYSRIRYLTTTLDPESTLVHEYVDLAVKRYEYINRLSGAFGAKFVLFLQPLYWTEDCKALDPAVASEEKKKLFDDSRFPATRTNFRTVYAALAKALKDKPYFINQRDILCPRKAMVYDQDGVHNTDYGRELISKSMLPHLRALLAPANKP